MATIIKLTYTLTGKATLINVDKITTAFRIYERTTSKYATRVNFDTDSYVIVDEELQEIKRLSENASDGDYSSNDWVDVDSGEGGIDVHQKFEKNYNQAYTRQQPQRRYNNHYQNNNERW
jgi:hypothetical protein